LHVLQSKCTVLEQSSDGCSVERFVVDGVHEPRQCSVERAVDALNNGSIFAPEGLCVILSQSYNVYFLLWRADKEGEAIKLCSKVLSPPQKVGFPAEILIPLIPERRARLPGDDDDDDEDLKKEDRRWGAIPKGGVGAPSTSSVDMWGGTCTRPNSVVDDDDARAGHPANQAQSIALEQRVALLEAQLKQTAELKLQMESKSVEQTEEVSNEEKEGGGIQEERSCSAEHDSKKKGGA